MKSRIPEVALKRPVPVFFNRETWVKHRRKVLVSFRPSDDPLRSRIRFPYVPNYLFYIMVASWWSLKFEVRRARHEMCVDIFNTYLEYFIWYMIWWSMRIDCLYCMLGVRTSVDLLLGSETTSGVAEEQRSCHSGSTAGTWIWMFSCHVKDGTSHPWIKAPVVALDCTWLSIIYSIQDIFAFFPIGHV